MLDSIISFFGAILSKIFSGTYKSTKISADKNKAKGDMTITINNDSNNEKE